MNNWVKVFKSSVDVSRHVPPRVWVARLMSLFDPTHLLWNASSEMKIWNVNFIQLFQSYNSMYWSMGFGGRIDCFCYIRLTGRLAGALHHFKKNWNVNFVEEVVGFNLSRLFAGCEVKMEAVSTELAADTVCAIAAAYIYSACLIVA